MPRQILLLCLALLLPAVAHAQPTTPEAAAIEAGRLFFFDTRLSQNNSTSCASCHDPNKGTSDGRPIAVGRIGERQFPQGIKGNRRTPPILNAALIPGERMFWDGRRQGLFDQASGPIENPDEMASTNNSQTVSQVANRMNRYEGYRTLMRTAFGQPDVTSQRMLTCLVAFEKQIVSTDTMLGRHLAGEATTLSESATRGAAVFAANCVRCHAGNVLTTGKFANTGIQFLYGDGRDEGLRKTTLDDKDLRAYKIPSLVGVSQRPPFMHNGTLPTLGHVVEHYSRGGVLKNQSDPRLTIKPLNFSDEQKRDLEAVLVEGTVPLDLRPIRVPTLEELPR
jgi:cytochrome c peroxidase